MKTIIGTVVLASLALVGGTAHAAPTTADATAGAKIIAPLQVTKKVDLYFGTIAPSLTDAGVVAIAADGSRDCGIQLTCLTADNTAAAFAVTGEMDAAYTISLPSKIQIANGAGNTMDVYDFVGSKAAGTLAGGSDMFTVGGKLAVAAKQPAGVYKGNFTVAVEYQ